MGGRWGGHKDGEWLKELVVRVVGLLGSCGSGCASYLGQGNLCRTEVGPKAGPKDWRVVGPVVGLAVGIASEGNGLGRPVG